jgi:sugar phosphate isomerase/epimerase
MVPPFPTGNNRSAADFRQLLDEHGIRRVVLDGAMGMLPRCAFAQQYGMTAEQHFQVAGLYRVNCFNVPHYRGDPAAPVNEFADGLAPFCERAAAMDCTVALEFLPGTGIPDIERALRIVAATGAANIGIALDTWHWARCRATLADIRALPAGIIKDFQISDRAADQDTLPDEEQFGRLVPGAGALPLVEIIRAVHANAPELTVNAEVFSRQLLQQEPGAAARQIAAGLRGVLAQL